jgi:hypothetical protein
MWGPSFLAVFMAVFMAFGSLYHFLACVRARGRFGLLPVPSSLCPFFSTHLHLEPLFFWLIRRKSFHRRRTGVPGSRVRRVHAARPMRHRVPVLIALRLALVSPPPSSSPALRFGYSFLSPPGTSGPRSPTPRLVAIQERRPRGRLQGGSEFSAVAG